MTEWAKGYSAAYYMALVDRATWKDIDRVEVTAGNITREETALRESADIECINYKGGIEQWIRVYLDVNQNGSNEHIPLFTGLATSPEVKIDGVINQNTIQCYSVLKPAEDVILKRGWYAPAGMNSGGIIKQLLSVTPAPVEIEDNAPVLTNAIIAEDNETHLSMIDKLLTAMNWRLIILGDGTISIRPQPIDPVITFDPYGNDVIEPEITVSQDWYECPNVFMAVNGDLYGVARDDSEDSPLSTVNRGREVWAVETDCELTDNESVSEYAQRRLQEKQRPEKSAQYNRRYYPNLYVSDLIQLHYPNQELDGVYRIESQGITLGHSARTQEKVNEV